MSAEVKIPQVGESITEGLLAEWSRSSGDVVAVDEPLLVLETDKVTMTVNAEHSGRLEVLVPAGEQVSIGQVVGRIDTSVSPAQGAAPSAPPETPSAPEMPAAGTAEPPLTTPAGFPQAHAKLAGVEHLSPAAQRLVVEHHLDPSVIPASGRDGRLTKEDVLRHLEQRSGAPAAAQPPTAPLTPAPAPPPPQAPPRTASPPPVSPAAPPAGERQTRTPMTPLRARIAERLVQAQQNAAILTTFNEVDMTRVLELRSRFRGQFKERFGVDLGLMSFFLKASVDALKTVPQVNAFIEGDQIVTNHYYDIGIAVSTEKGLVVPVLRNVDQLPMAEVERQLVLLAERARDRKLELSDLIGGVFTVSNGGVFGSILSTPFLNPPQSAILGMHTIKKRPVVVDDQVVVRPMMYLALSYDHRLVDGREAVTFLRRIVDCVENPERMLLEV